MYFIKKEYIDDQSLTLIEVRQKNIRVSFMDYGATIMNIFVPDKYGKYETVVMGFDSLSSYFENTLYLNSIIGPTSGRIGSATFSINNQEYNLDKNYLGKVNLHGGSETFAYKIFEYKVIDSDNSTKVVFRLSKKQTESKYPGNQEIEIIYTVTENNLLIVFNVETDQDTLVNLTNHAYFNLSGNLKSKILNHELYLNCSNIIQLDKYDVPCEIENIIDTKLDYKQSRKVQSKDFTGIDYPFLIDVVDFLMPCAILKDPLSKRKLEVFTTYECLVCYTHEYPNDSKLLFGMNQEKNQGICFEAQHSPNGINVKGLDDSILRKGETYHHKTLFKFSIEEN